MIKASIQAIDAASTELGKKYYRGVEKLKDEGLIEGFVKLNIRARVRGYGLEIAWFNARFRAKARAFESIKKQRGNSDYNMSILKANGIEGMYALIEQIELEARVLRQAHKRLLEFKKALEVMQSRLGDLSPELVAAINAVNGGSERSVAERMQQHIDFDLDQA